MTQSDLQWAIRPASGSDLNFLYSTWLNSYRCDSKIGKSTKKSVYFGEYYSVVDSILEKAKTLIACLSEEPNVIVGFLVFEPQVLHYCFTKESFRGLGVARSLYDRAFGGAGALFHTHKTRQAEPILEKLPALTYNPFLLFTRVNSPKLEEIDGKT